MQLDVEVSTPANVLYFTLESASTLILVLLESTIYPPPTVCFLFGQNSLCTFLAKSTQ